MFVHILKNASQNGIWTNLNPCFFLSWQFYFDTDLTADTFSRIVQRGNEVRSSNALRHVTPSQLIPLLRRSPAFHERKDQLYFVSGAPFFSFEDSIGDVTTDQRAQTLVTTDQNDVIKAISASVVLKLENGNLRLVFSFYPSKEFLASAMVQLMTPHLQRHLVVFSRSYPVKEAAVSVILEQSGDLQEGQVADKLQELLGVRPSASNLVARLGDFWTSEGKPALFDWT